METGRIEIVQPVLNVSNSKSRNKQTDQSFFMGSLPSSQDSQKKELLISGEDSRSKIMNMEQKSYEEISLLTEERMHHFNEIMKSETDDLKVLSPGIKVREVDQSIVSMNINFIQDQYE